MSNEDPRFRLFHHWLILLGLIVFGVYLAFDSGIYAAVVSSDPSRLSIVISVLFVAGCVHCGILGFRLACEDDALLTMRGDISADPEHFVETLSEASPTGAPSAARAYFGALSARLGAAGSLQAGEYSQLTDVLAEQVRGQNEAGWFVTNMLVKLGLLGTVIGFILMLSSVMSIESFDISEAQGLLGTMTVGMGVALNTTMLGLVCSMLLGMQYLMMDRGADRLIADAVLIAESELVPCLERRRNGV